MVISAIVFISGSIRFDLLQEIQFELHGRTNLPYVLLYICEEFLEMLGSSFLFMHLLPINPLTSRLIEKRFSNNYI